MPVWWDVSFLTGSVGPAITFDASNRDFARPGAFSHAVLCHSITGEYLAIEIAYDSIGGFWLLKDPIDPAQWPIGTRIYPARIVQLPTSQMLAHITAGVTTLSVDARVVDNRNWQAASTPEHLEYLEPNRIRPISAGLERLVGVADFSVGGVSVTDFGGRAFRSATHEYLCETRADLAKIREALAHLAGRLGTLRMPTFQADLSSGFDSIPSTSIIFAAPAGYAALFEKGVDLYVKPLNGQSPMIARPYGAWFDSDEYGDEVEFDPPLPISFEKNDVKISLVYTSRLASDTVEILHHTAEVSEVAISYRSIK